MVLENLYTVSRAELSLLFSAVAKTATTATKGVKETDETQEKTVTEDKQKNEQKKQQPKSSAETQNADCRQSAASGQPTVPQNSSEHEQVIRHSSFASVYSETVAGQMPEDSGLHNLQVIQSVKIQDVSKVPSHCLNNYNFAVKQSN
jgi:hypothetical protein